MDGNPEQGMFYHRNEASCAHALTSKEALCLHVGSRQTTDTTWSAVPTYLRCDLNIKVQEWTLEGSFFLCSTYIRQTAAEFCRFTEDQEFHTGTVSSVYSAPTTLNVVTTWCEKQLKHQEKQRLDLMAANHLHQHVMGYIEMWRDRLIS